MYDCNDIMLDLKYHGNTDSRVIEFKKLILKGILSGNSRKEFHLFIGKKTDLIYRIYVNKECDMDFLSHFSWHLTDDVFDEQKYYLIVRKSMSNTKINNGFKRVK